MEDVHSHSCPHPTGVALTVTALVAGLLVFLRRLPPLSRVDGRKGGSGGGRVWHAPQRPDVYAEQPRGTAVNVRGSVVSAPTQACADMRSCLMCCVCEVPWWRAAARNNTPPPPPPPPKVPPGPPFRWLARWYMPSLAIVGSLRGAGLLHAVAGIPKAAQRWRLQHLAHFERERPPPACFHYHGHPPSHTGESRAPPHTRSIAPTGSFRAFLAFGRRWAPGMTVTVIEAPVVGRAAGTRCGVDWRSFKEHPECDLRQAVHHAGGSLMRARCCYSFQLAVPESNQPAYQPSRVIPASTGWAPVDASADAGPQPVPQRRHGKLLP